MPEKNQGLADNQDGDFILNETGTSVSIDRPEEGVAGDFVDSEDKRPDEKTGVLRGNENASTLSGTDNA